MTPRRALAPSALVLALCLLAACEDSVSPFIETDRYFTLYGFLDTDQPVQYVRVIPVRRRVDVPAPAPLGATVRTRDLDTGETQAWQDSVVTFSDGSWGNVYFSPFTPLFGHRYQIEVADAEGRTTRAETVVPAARRARVGPLYVSLSLRQDVLWPDVDYVPFRVQTWYRFARVQNRDQFIDVAVNYPDADLGTGSFEGWRVTALLGQDVQKVREQVEFNTPPELYAVGMKISVTSSDWRPPGGVFDPEILVEPGTFTNVENGFGFFGAIAHLNAEWTLPDAAYRSLGYLNPAR